MRACEVAVGAVPERHLNQGERQPQLRADGGVEDLQADSLASSSSLYCAVTSEPRCAEDVV